MAGYFLIEEVTVPLFRWVNSQIVAVAYTSLFPAIVHRMSKKDAFIHELGATGGDADHDATACSRVATSQASARAPA